LKEKCKKKESKKAKQESSLPLGAAYSTVGGSSKTMLREDPEK